MKPLLKTLSPETVDLLITWCQELDNYTAVRRRALEELKLSISESSLCRLYTRHRIVEDQSARDEYLSTSASPSPVNSDGSQPPQTTPAAALLGLAKDQLQLRLVELGSRTDLTANELRALFQVINRIEALTLSHRRVELAEKRETRLAKLAEPPPLPLLTREERNRRLKNIFGLVTDPDPEPTPVPQIIPPQPPTGATNNVLPQDENSPNNNFAL